MGALLLGTPSALGDNSMSIAVCQGDIDLTGTGTSFEISAARDISDNFAIKVSFIDVGEMEFNDDITAGNLDNHLFEVVNVGHYAFADTLNLLTIAGVTSWTLSIQWSGFYFWPRFELSD